MGTSAANSHHGQQYPLHKQPECKAANSSNLHHAKTCSPRADHVSTLSGRRGFKTLTTQERKLLRRRQAIEPIIGHLKADHRMARCHLKGEQGDRLHAVLCAAGYNLRWLLRMIAKKGVPFLRRLYLRLRKTVAPSPNWARMLRNLAVNAFREPAPRLVAG